MREIKFRGKARGEWVRGSLIVCEDGHCVINWVDGLRHVSTDIGVAPETVGQFTGLLDCDGREIYERDIVDFTENICDGDEVIIQGRGYVKYDDNTAAFVIVNNNGFIPFICIGEMRIVGNAHDNPTLLGRNP